VENREKRRGSKAEKRREEWGAGKEQWGEREGGGRKT